MSDTPITDKIISDADSTPETRVVFLIKHLANKCKEFERELSSMPATWSKDSSLETWFPFSAEELKKLKYDAEWLKVVLKYSEQVLEDVKQYLAADGRRMPSVDDALHKIKSAL